MIKNITYRISQMIMMTCLLMLMTSCRETIESIFSDDIAEGDEVMFTAELSRAAMTRGDVGYETLKENYLFSIGMYTDENTKVGENGIYSVIDDDLTGSLKAETPLYWPSTKVAYGFKATAGTENLEKDQSTKEKWLLQDRLEGKTDDYRTAKDWKIYNVGNGLTDNDDDYKKIPLYLKHKRSLITIILKAGEGVSRKALAYDVAENDLKARIYSYSSGSMEITPLAGETLIDYDADKNGAAESEVSSTRYDAIVEPYDYTINAEKDLIAKISLSGQNYSFYAGNDAVSDVANYNLEGGGKHLTITVTLSRDSRKVMMSAYIEDWTEEVTTTICDDYGNAGEPIEIKNRDELIDFLGSETKNKAGNVALVTNSIDLGTWAETYDLNCTLNLGGCTLLSNYRFLDKIGDAASVQNGTIQIGGIVDAAIAQTNCGTIEDVRITAKDGTTACATQAGAVINNTGTISKCHSSLKVSGGSEGFVGGIAATSTSSPSKTSIIDGCIVSNSVGGGASGGGIVGKANGYITNNTFEYGITLNQVKATHKNIVAVRDDGHETFNVDNNSWPTEDDCLNMTNATSEDELYDGIIDSQAELLESVKPAYNSEGKSYRLAQDIYVNQTIGDVAYNLDGNNKQITTSAMIFNSITGVVRDLTIYVSKSLISTQDQTAATDAIAPLAFEVHGDRAAINNIKVKMADGAIIQSSNPAGVVVWAWGGATVSNCEAKVNIYANVATSISQGRKFAGGIVSTVSNATVTQCILHSGSVLSGTDATILYYGGIVGGIEKKDNDSYNPELTITDCICFVAVAKDEHHGGILGNSKLGTSAVATSDKCQGNWWPNDCNGVGTKDGSDESTIGKRNSVTPTEKTNW